MIGLDYSDTFKEDQEAVLVTTIHKSKGREFDHVHLVWADTAPLGEEEWRVLYVGMTRAKAELHIHSLHPVFDRLHWKDGEVLTHQGHAESFREIEFQCGLKDVVLGRLQSHEVSKACKAMVAGQRLTPNGLEGFRLRDVGMLAFSEKFQEKLRKWAAKGYVMDDMSIDHIVYWRKEDMPEAVPVILPRMRMHRP